MPIQTVVVSIPIYKESLNEDELMSLKQCINILSNYPIIFFAPQNLNTEVYKKLCGKNIPFKTEVFDDVYFKDVSGYNKLMLSTLFYERFNNYKYMLIYQLDAWIFKDDLAAWCNKNYDYIGAPWVNWEWSSFYAHHTTFLRRLLYKFGYRKFNMVGNGGLSLRKIDSFIKNLNFFKQQALKFKQNEDYFFSFFVSTYNPFFKIPKVSEALQFAFDENPDQALILNNGNLPLGCHAWPKYKSFWKNYIKNID